MSCNRTSSVATGETQDPTPTAVQRYSIHVEADGNVGGRDGAKLMEFPVRKTCIRIAPRHEKGCRLNTLHLRNAIVIPENLHKQASFTSKASTQKRHGYCHEIGADSRVHNISLEPAVEVDSSLTQEGLFISSVYPDDISVEATSFRQLQDVMEQVDAFPV